VCAFIEQCACWSLSAVLAVTDLSPNELQLVVAALKLELRQISKYTFDGLFGEVSLCLQACSIHSMPAGEWVYSAQRGCGN
jgi:hypothetical protein